MNDELFGRTRERELAHAMLAEAAEGRGGVLLLIGEAGIGKTKLAERVARDAVERGFCVAWGRAWEAGGAPPLWPWSEIFRALGEEDVFATTDDASMNARDVRFRHFDRCRQRLARMATRMPLVLVLDDLHAADPTSLSLLQLVARGLEGMRVLVVGTYRDAEARIGETGTQLAKIGREGRVVRLDRLSANDVLAWVQRIAPSISPEDAWKVHDITDGNPLFIHEVLQVGVPLDPRRLPDGLRAVLDAHVARLRPEVADLLATASVLGRHLDASDVVDLARTDEDAATMLLGEACDAGVLEPAGPRRWGFTHALLRERLYEGLAPSRRAALHWQAGQHALAVRSDLAIAAHHLQEGHSAGEPIKAARVAREAATEAMARLAFEDAGEIATRGLDVLEGKDPVLACELELLRAEAFIRSGEGPRGKERCIHAASLARAIGSAPLEARAALAYAAELASANLDNTMVRLLRSALEAFGTTPSALRARVMARLAAALDPFPSEAIAKEASALAREALTLARALEDPETLLFVAYYVFIATRYQVAHDERFEAVRLVIDLAKELGRDLVLVDAAPWWIAMLRERGLRTEAALALEEHACRIDELPQAHYRWRLPMLRATMAMADGDFDACERLGREALAIAESGEVYMGIGGWCLHRIALAMLRDDPGFLAPDAERILATLAPIAGCAEGVAYVLAAIGRTAEARQRLSSVPFVKWRMPPTACSAAATALLGDRELAAHLFPVVEDHATRFVFYWVPPHASAVLGPTSLVLADLAALLGRKDEARRYYAEAIAIAEKLGTPGFATVAKGRHAALGGVAPVPTGGHVSLVREGDVWLITSFTGKAVRLKDAKGLHYLDRLLAQPNREFHAADLAGLDEPSGDAGPALDAAAKASYRRRLEDLSDQRDEAHRFGDLGRVERAQREIDAIASQLRSAMGLGGRDRKAASTAERARINVQRGIRRVCDQIGEHDAELARYLDATIKTGIFCVFTPLKNR